MLCLTNRRLSIETSNRSKIHIITEIRNIFKKRCEFLSSLYELKTSHIVTIQNTIKQLNSI